MNEGPDWVPHQSAPVDGTGQWKEPEGRDGKRAKNILNEQSASVYGAPLSRLNGRRTEQLSIRVLKCVGEGERFARTFTFHQISTQWSNRSEVIGWFPWISRVRKVKPVLSVACSCNVKFYTEDVWNRPSCRWPKCSRKYVCAQMWKRMRFERLWKCEKISNHKTQINIPDGKAPPSLWPNNRTYQFSTLSLFSVWFHFAFNLRFGGTPPDLPMVGKCLPPGVKEGG